MNNEPFIFLHVPKTAGTTLRAIIERQYSEEEIFSVYEGAAEHHSMAELTALDAEAKKKIRIYCGHFGFGVHRHIGGNPKYITMLRDPVERVISYYHHAMTLSPEWKDKPISLLKFLQGRQDVQVDNMQTRMLSGIHKPFGQCTDAMLLQAVDHIQQSFCAVGVSENFDESLQLIADLAHWRTPYYVRENVGKERPTTRYFSDMELDAVKNHNRLDIQLCDYARRRAQELIACDTKDFHVRVTNFKAANALSGERLTAKAVWS